MSRLLKADFYRMLKNRLSRIALILAIAFPVLLVLLYVGMDVLTTADVEEALAEDVSMFSANTVIGSVYSLTNNIGLVIPAFAGILVCTDHTNGTLRNKIIAGNRRNAIYLSHLIVSIVFAVTVITIYAAITTALALIFFPFSKDPSVNLGLEVFRFITYGTMTFVFAASVSTLFAMTFRNMAPTIIFSIVLSVVLMAVNSVLMLIDYSAFRHIVYAIPTFAGNFLNLGSFSLSALLGGVETNTGVLYAEGMLSYLFFSVLNTVIGLLAFRRRDVK